MQYKYLFFTLFIFTLLTCNKTDDLLDNQLIIEKANGVIHTTMKDDRDGKIYATIIVDSLEWMNENLEYNKNGDSKFIFCPEDEDGEEQCGEGKLYDFSRSYCPSGWQKPTRDQWIGLFSYFFDGEIDDVGKHMKLGGYNFQYAGAGEDLSNDASSVVFFDFKEFGYFIAEDNYYLWIDTLGRLGIYDSPYVNFASCRCVRRVSPSDNPFFDQCSDGIMNGDETGVDCGGVDCDPCPASCSDGVMNGDETGIDCGGSSCSPCPQLFTDARDGKQYSYAEFGNQTWMTENLNYAGGGFCYDDLESNCDTYGRLYGYDDILNQVCPEGWHIPSDNDYLILEAFFGMNDTDLNDFALANSRGVAEEIGNQMKTTDWLSTGSNVTSNGFNALPGGFLGDDGTSYFIGDKAYFITNQVGSGPTILQRIIRKEYAGVGRTTLVEVAGVEAKAASCRCIKN